MEVEHTRDGMVAFYGDFGRYTFQSNFSSWEQLNPIDLKNIAIKRVFDLGYDVKKHGKFDKRIHDRHYDRHYVATERIGKKYQWIVMHELLAQVADNYKMKDDLSENENTINFQGPWIPLIRDIDPTVLKYKKAKSKPAFPPLEEYYNNWGYDNNSWLKIDDYPDPLEFINIDLDNYNWLLLEGNIDWKEPESLGNEKYKYPQKQLWYQIRNYLVTKNDFKGIIQRLNNKNFMGRWMPESYERGEIFDREFYWSPAYKYFLKNYYKNTYLQKIKTNRSGEEIGEVIVTTESNAWGSKTIYRMMANHMD